MAAATPRRGRASTRRRRRSPRARPRQADRGQRRGAGGGRALHLEPLEIGGRLLQRLLDGQLERDLRGGAVGAAALQPEQRDAVHQAETARRRRRATPCTAARCRAPPAPGGQRYRVQVVDHSRVATSGSSARAARSAGRPGPRRARPSSARARRRTAGRRRHQLVRHLPVASPAAWSPACRSCTRPTSSSAASVGEVPRSPRYASAVGVCTTLRTLPLRCTCVRRTAGTGRTSGRPA